MNKRMRSIGLAIFVTVALLPLAACEPDPPAFEKIEVLDGLSDPTSFRFAPNGDIFIAEQAGAIKILRGTQVITIGSVATINDHEKGLLGIELDQNFATNHYLYASYTHTDGFARLSRFMVHDDMLDLGSETVFYQSDQVASIYHNANDIHHGPDGKIWWSVGDNLATGNSQSLQSIHGKIARFDVDGSSANDNPWHGDADKVDETYALGLRNPFRFTFLPNGKAIVGDVGGAQFEELNVVAPGANYGWPQYEGDCGSCGYANPVFAYPHDGENSAISALAVYDGTTFPAEYDGVVFYGDYARQTIRYLTFDAGYDSVLSDSTFDDDAGTVVDMHVGPDGNLYSLSIFQGTLFKYVPAAGNRTPNAVASADPIAGLAPLDVSFSAAGSSDPDGTALTYSWDFGDGATSTGANPTHTYTANGTYDATLTVSDGDKSDTATVPITVGNELPAATIVSPTVGTTYDAGDTITYGATATDPEDGVLPASAYSWKVVFHHAEHVHPYLGPITGAPGGSFTIGRDATNESNTWYRIELTVTDSAGLKHTTSRDVNPHLVNLTVQSNTPGGKFTIDGNLYSAPYVHQEVVGVDHGVGVSSPQTIDGAKHRFRAWSDGGAATHTYRVPPTDSTLTAELFEALPVPSPWASTDIGNPALVGTADYDGEYQAFTLDGGGDDIWQSTDQFRYVYQPLSGNGEIVARITSQSAADPWTKSGIMIKQSAAAGATYAMVSATPVNGLVMQYDFDSNAGPRPTYEFPVWLKLTRADDVFTSFHSTDGTTWTQLGQATVAMSSATTVGMFVTAHTDAALSSTVFDNVSVADLGPIPNTPPTASDASFSTTQDTPVATSLTATDPNADPLTFAVVSPPAHGMLSGTAPALTYAPVPGYFGADSFTFTANDGQADSGVATVSLSITPPGGPIPAPWLEADVGTVTPAPGSALYDDATGTFAISGGGYDIWGTHDDFRYVYQPLDGDGEIVARLTSQTTTHASAKAGVMIKESPTAFAPYSLLGTTPANGYKFQWNFLNQSISAGSFTLPNAWMKLTRAGDVITAYVSADGAGWTQVAQKTVTMSPAATIGLFVTSHDAGQIGTATFDHVTVNP